MCGIVGYVGEDDALPVLIDGLKRLEYRGYDSAGIAILKDNRLELRRSVGKLANLEKSVIGDDLKSGLGIGHTRWATHGRPTEENAHPHTDCKNEIAVVHNGIIENFKELRTKLIKEGHKFKSETDTEIFAHLIEKYLQKSKDIEASVIKACEEVEGTFALAVISNKFPDKLIAARKGSPLVIGIGDNKQMYIASDVPAILNKTRKVVILEEEELAVISKGKFQINDFDGRSVEKNITTIEWDPITAEKGGYKHFMLKEIFEQPQVIEDTLRGRISQDKVVLDEINIPNSFFNKLKKITVLACGTAWHAGLVSKFMFEELTKIPTEVDYASEFRYRNPIITDNNLVVAISQSGETADTLAAVREAKQKGAKILAVCNVIGSTLTREADGNLYIHAGPEIGVASTKAFTAQLSVLYLLALYIAQVKGMFNDEMEGMLNDIRKIPAKISKILSKNDEISEIARYYFKYRDFLYLGRGTTYPIALEGALKLKEISYIHAEGYSAGEMKHGPIALIDENMPVVAIATKSRTYEKIISNIEETRARDGIVIAIATEKDTEIVKRVRDCIYVPTTNEMLLPILTVVPLQLLAYHIAVRRGCDVDQPRNLAKSVTVE